MSLINQMLRDLENRREHEQVSNEGIHAVKTRHASLRGWLRTLLAMLVSAAVVAAIFWYFGSWHVTTKPAASAETATTVQAASTSIPTHMPRPTIQPNQAESPVIPPAKLVKAAFTPQKQGGYKLALSFDRSVDYRLHTPSAGSHVTFDVADAAMPSQPLFAGPLPDGISTVQLGRHDQGIRLEISLAHAMTAAIEPGNPGEEKTVIIAFGTKPRPAAELAANNSTARVPANPAKQTTVSKLAVSKHQAVAVHDSSATGGDIVKTPRKQTPAQHSQDAYKRGLAAANAGDPVEAETNFNNALAYNADNASARQALAALLLRTGRATDAERIYAAGVTQGSHNILFAQLDARLLANLGKRAKAVTVLESLSPPIGAHPAYYAMLAALEQQQKNYARAENLYERLVAIRPGAGIWWMGLGLSREHLNKPREALDAYHHAQSTGTLTGAVAEFVQQRITALGN